MVLNSMPTCSRSLYSLPKVILFEKSKIAIQRQQPLRKSLTCLLVWECMSKWVVLNSGNLCKCTLIGSEKCLAALSPDSARLIYHVRQEDVFEPWFSSIRFLFVLLGIGGTLLYPESNWDALIHSVYFAECPLYLTIILPTRKKTWTKTRRL